MKTTTFVGQINWKLRSGEIIEVYWEGEHLTDIDIWYMDTLGEENELGELDFDEAAEIEIEVQKDYYETKGDRGDQFDVHFVSDFDMDGGEWDD